MNWLPVEQESGRQNSADWLYMITRNSRNEFIAWRRVPYFKRLGQPFSRREQACAACESHARTAR